MTRLRDAQGNIIKPSPAIVKRSLDDVIRSGVNSQHGTMGTEEGGHGREGGDLNKNSDDIGAKGY